jgi:class 3 adenylate cyclase
MAPPLEPVKIEPRHDRRRRDMQVKGRRTSRRKTRKAPAAHVVTADLQKQVAALTREVKEAREQQTATSEVLQVISSSSGELAPVFESLLASAKHLCGAEFGIILLREGDAFRTVALHGTTAAYTEARWRAPLLRPAADTGLGRVLETKQAVQIADVRAVAGYVDNPVQAPIVQLAGVRSKLSVPMLKEEDLIGVIEIDRQEVRPFTDKQIELVQNFAAQAVIAIENARLLDDLNKLNQQLEQRVTDQVSEIERMGRLRRFLPPQVADLIVASGTEKQLESHRREITALFCDLRGFTGFSESSDPEDVMALLHEYHAAIGGIINKYGGTLERYAGDGVMVVFNDPIPVENPALQAVLMAVDMRAAIGGLIEKWCKLGHDIGFGIGIAHGFATLGTIGFEGRFDYAAIGTVSNVASRLCDEAKPGQILISPRVLMAVEKDVAVEPVGDFSLKGIRRPLTAYNVLHNKAAD